MFCRNTAISVSIFMLVAGSILTALGQYQMKIFFFQMRWFLDVWIWFFKYNGFHFFRWNVCCVILLSKTLMYWNLTISFFISLIRKIISAESFFHLIIYQKDVMNVRLNLKVGGWKITIFFSIIIKLEVAGTSNYQLMSLNAAQYSTISSVLINTKNFIISIKSK